MNEEEYRAALQKLPVWEQQQRKHFEAILKKRGHGTVQICLHATCHVYVSLIYQGPNYIGTGLVSDYEIIAEGHTNFESMRFSTLSHALKVFGNLVDLLSHTEPADLMVARLRVERCRDDLSRAENDYENAKSVAVGA